MSEKLPKEWALGQFGAVVENHDGRRVPVKATDRAKRQGRFPYFGASGVIDHVDDYLFDGSYLLIAEDGANLLSRSTPIAFQASGQFWVNNHAHIVQAYAGISQRYLEQFVNSIDLAPYVSGSAQPKLTQKSLDTIPVPVAPSAEQDRIVAKIDSLFARSSRARDELARIPRLIERYRQAVLESAFRGDLTADWRDRNPGHEPMANRLAHVRAARLQAKLGNRRRDALANLPKPPPDLPPLPHGWEWICVEELASDAPRSIQSGPFGSNLKHSEFTNDGMLVIGIDNAQDGYFSMGSQNRISPEKFQELIKYKALPGDVLITVMATVGRCCVVPDDIEPSIITKHVYRITCEHEIILPLFLMNALRGSADVLRQMGAEIRGQTRPGINGSILKGLFIPLPPVAEQMLIVKRVEEAFACTQRGSEEASRASDLLTRLDASILDKAFSGKLVPQDPDDEPASALLERIRVARAEAPKPKRGRRAKG